jgi:hypothetical protein
MREYKRFAGLDVIPAASENLRFFLVRAYKG